VDATLCPKEDHQIHKISCIERHCKNCGVNNLDDILPLHQNHHDACTCTEVDGVKICSQPVKWKGYEHVDIPSKDGTKRRFSFVDKTRSLEEFSNKL